MKIDVGVKVVAESVLELELKIKEEGDAMSQLA